jgi:hypothetical protein
MIIKLCFRIAKDGVEPAMPSVFECVANRFLLPLPGARIHQCSVRRALCREDPTDGHTLPFRQASWLSKPDPLTAPVLFNKRNACAFKSSFYRKNRVLGNLPSLFLEVDDR